MSAIPRALMFQSITNYVHGSRQMPAPSVPSTNARGVILSSHMQKFPLSVESLYDKYNRSNLLLKDCHSKDIQMLHKCIIVAEEGLGSELQQQIAKRCQREKIKTQNNTNNGSKNRMNKTQQSTFFLKKNEPGLSVDSQANELLFNYKKLAQEKKSRKKAFLSGIEAKISQIEQGTAELEQVQIVEQQQLFEIHSLQNRIGQTLHEDIFKGKVSQLAHEAELEQPILNGGMQRDLNIYMPKEEINELLEQRYQQNENLMDEIARITLPTNYARSSTSFAKIKKQQQNAIKKTSKNLSTTLRKKM